MFYFTFKFINKMTVRIYVISLLTFLSNKVYFSCPLHKHQNLLSNYHYLVIQHATQNTFTFQFD